jgi:hypothetical protein
MSESSIPLKRRQLAQLGPLVIISIGIILSFACAAFLAWLIVCAFSGLI